MTSQVGKMEEQGSKTHLERVLAALAHASILLRLLPLNFVGGAYAGLGMGIAVALCIWFVMKGKSAYVRGQALQAVVYQVAVVAVTMVWGMAWVLLLGGIFLIDLGSPPRWAGIPVVWIPMAFQWLAVLYALWGAVRCLGGYDFRYVIVSKLVDRLL